MNPSATDYDSDKEPMPKEEHQLKWRGDPEKTHSDWKVEIVICGCDNNHGEESENHCNVALPQIETYHVHKCFLGYGPNGSSYFERLFQTSERYAEADSCTSRIELDSLAAKAIPNLLDFVYSSNDKALNINTENCTALHYLGQYFEIRRLRWLARQFWKKDLSLKNVDVYYEHAKIFHDDKLLQAVAVTCSYNIMKIKVTSRIVQISHPDMWVEILEEANDCPYTRLHISSLIAENCSNNATDFETFQRLTPEEKLPKIAFDAASKFSDLEDRIGVTDDGEGNRESEADHNLSSLQQRCIESISENWEKLDVASQETMDFLKRKKPSFLAELLAKSLIRAKTAIEAAKERAEEASSRAALATSRAEVANNREAEVTTTLRRVHQQRVENLANRRLQSPNTSAMRRLSTMHIANNRF